MSNQDFVIFEEDVVKIEGLMNKALKGAQGKCALLVDKDGHMIARQGFTHTLDTTALSALLAGSFASTKEIARLVGDPATVDEAECFRERAEDSQVVVQRDADHEGGDRDGQAVARRYSASAE